MNDIQQFIITVCAETEEVCDTEEEEQMTKETILANEQVS
jgi:hypothetical protein